MKIMTISSVTLFTICLLISFCDAKVLKDFCVADYTAPQHAGGYSCKSPEKVTVDDFVYSGLATPGNTSNLIKASFPNAFSYQFPGVNGLGVTLSRGDLAPGGIIPVHSHPGVTEIILVVKGSITAGFVSTANNVYIKTLKEGDIFAVPQGLIHFGVNTGPSQALVFASFSDENPGVQVMDLALFGNNFPTDLVSKTTFLDPAVIKKLKAVFGGSG
ncbi:hypothetical protein FEM48_Zijuj08G0019800 [Ziziphus jujuba var. spinosa]|uniref:Germin-like protein n=1 Tax=Ziziphus jujuba var. spinosa TaxID=714518 RepID=A0A978UWB9_ZIZJJ|nr:hypothetical protein FEM48_Zijuj08G0019800 [Ziziphus jujuba var. spinosa]